MSNYLIKGETLTNIADAIRTKTGKTDSIATENMATEISGISAIIEVSELPTTNINTNAVYSMGGKFYKYEETTVSTTVAPNDLTGYTVTVPSGWTATAGYGWYNVDYDEYKYDSSFSALYIGYGYEPLGRGFPLMEEMPNSVAFGSSTLMSVTNDEEITITITGGDDATNAELIQWLTNNNATFSKSEYAWVEYSSGGLTINGIIKQYKVQANKTVNAGDFVEFVKAVSWGSGTFNSGNSKYIVASKLNDSSALVVYQDISNSNYGKAIVLSISDSGISIGAETAFNSAATSFIGLCVLSDTKALVVFRDEGNSDKGTAVVLTISGTAITVGTKYVYDSGVAGMNFVTALNDSKAIVFYIDYSDSNKSKAIVLSINETTITKGSETVIDSGKSYSYYPSAVALNDSQVLLTYASKSNSEYGTAVVLTISGTSISIGTKTVFKSATTHYCSTVLLNTNKVLVTYLAGGNGTAQILTVSGNSITVEAETVFNSGISYYISTTALSDTKALVTYQDYNNSKYGTAIVLSVNGTTVTAGEKLVFNKATTTYSCPAVLSSSSAVVFANSGGYKGLSIDGTTITLNSEVKSETLVRASEGVINGVANTSGTAGETVEVYVPAPKGYTVTLIADYGTNNGQYSIDGGTTWVTIPVGQTTTLSNVETIMFKCASGYGVDYHTTIGTTEYSSNIALLADTQTSENITLTADTIYYISEYTTSGGGGSN